MFLFLVIMKDWTISIYWSKTVCVHNALYNLQSYDPFLSKLGSTWPNKIYHRYRKTKI